MADKVGDNLISVTCPACHKTLTVPDKYDHHEIRCSHCRQEFTADADREQLMRERRRQEKQQEKQQRREQAEAVRAKGTTASESIAGFFGCFVVLAGMLILFFSGVLGALVVIIGLLIWGLTMLSGFRRMLWYMYEHKND